MRTVSAGGRDMRAPESDAPCVRNWPSSLLSVESSGVPDKLDARSEVLAVGNGKDTDSDVSRSCAFNSSTDVGGSGAADGAGRVVLSVASEELGKSVVSEIDCVIEACGHIPGRDS